MGNFLSLFNFEINAWNIYPPFLLYFYKNVFKNHDLYPQYSILYFKPKTFQAQVGYRGGTDYFFGLGNHKNYIYTENLIEITAAIHGMTHHT
jgi:hypothetical protein